MTPEERRQIRANAKDGYITTRPDKLILRLLDELERVEAERDDNENAGRELMAELADACNNVAIWSETAEQASEALTKVVGERDVLRAALREINLQTGIENARVIAFDALAAGSSQEHQ